VAELPDLKQLSHDEKDAFQPAAIGGQEGEPG
jgi:hypothetical protein